MLSMPKDAIDSLEPFHNHMKHVLEERKTRVVKSSGATDRPTAKVVPCELFLNKLFEPMGKSSKEIDFYE